MVTCSPRLRCTGHYVERARFATLQIDLTSGELFRSGIRIPIQDKPFQLLRLLLEADGKPVGREQIRSALWPADTFVDFEHAVNTAVKKLRQALEDSAEQPRFIETLPKIGYRFIAPVAWIDEGERHAVGVTAGSSPPTSAPPILDAAPHSVESVVRPLSRPAWRSRPALVALGLCVLAVVCVQLLRPRSQTASEPPRVLPFTTFPGFEIAPSFSPDGNSISFSWFGYEKEFQFDLYVKQVGQERVLQLTHHPATFLASAWSPDGQSIAFMRQAEPDATGVYVIAPFGGAERKVASFTPMRGWEPFALSWTPDSKWLAYAKTGGRGTGESDIGHVAVHLVNVDTSEERTLPAPAVECVDTWQPAFSADGRTLASVCVLSGGVAKIYLQNADGSHPRALSGGSASEYLAGIAWTPDGRSLVYSADQHLWRVPLDGGPRERLLFAQDVESVSVARTGNRLAYAQVRHPQAIYRLDLVNTTTAAGAASRFISSSRGDLSPSMAPDGSAVAFQSDRSGSPEIWMCDRDGLNPVQLSNFAGPDVDAPHWSPDGHRIVFVVRVSGKAQLYIVDRGGGPPKRFDTGTPNAAHAVWSSDGRFIYFSTEEPEAVWKVPAAGGAPIRLTQPGGRSWPMLSADSGRVFFHNLHDKTDLWSVSADGADEHPVAGVPNAGWWWAVAAQGLYYTTGARRHFSLDVLRSGQPAISEGRRSPEPVHRGRTRSLERWPDDSVPRHRSQRGRHHARGGMEIGGRLWALGVWPLGRDRPGLRSAVYSLWSETVLDREKVM